MTALLFLLFIGTSSAKPKLEIAPDGFPIGQSTPEGAASDFTRAFVTHDVVAFRKLCIRPYQEEHASADYKKYVDGVAAHLRDPDPRALFDDPVKVVTVFAARHLSKSGPAAYGYAAFGFQDVMFVDVEVLLHNGQKYVHRTMVIQDRDNFWYVHPRPELSPMLSNGLYDESASAQRFKEADKVGK